MRNEFLVVDRLWNYLVKVFGGSVQTVQNHIVTHRVGDTVLVYTQFLQVKFTVFIHMIICVITLQKVTLYTQSTVPIITIYLNKGVMRT